MCFDCASAQGCSDFVNITLRDVSIERPLLSPGVLLGNETNPVRNVVFDNVTVQRAGRFPWHEDTPPWKGTYKSEFVEGVCVDCDPVPDGFTVLSRAEFDARFD